MQRFDHNPSPSLMPDDHLVKGHCLCGRVTLDIARLGRDVVYCHCSQCRRQTGHFYAAADARDEDLVVGGEEHLTWYAASDEAKRGFCRHCGSALFWKANGSGKTSILAGCLDMPTGHVAFDASRTTFESAPLPVR